VYIDNSEFKNEHYDYPISIRISSSIRDSFSRKRAWSAQSSYLPDVLEIPHFSILAPAKKLIETAWKRITHSADMALNDRVCVLKFLDVDSYIYGDT
jgi:hypothetical protein